MVIAFSGGGTLGHITPALSFIQEIKSRSKNVKIIFIATSKDEKYDILKNNINITKIYYLKAYGKPTKITDYCKTIYYDWKVLSTIKKILKEEKVDLVVGMGGYISGISIYIANKLKLKTIIHEQNSVIGFANKINFKKTDVILTTFKKTVGLEKYPFKTKWIGNPRYMDALKVKKSAFLDKKNILVTSGSLGSYQINHVMKEFMNSPFAKNYTITLISGKKYYDEIVSTIPVRFNFLIKPFTNNLLEEISKAGIVIARAGSTTLFEILGTHTPSIIIPSPNVTHHHQYYNAKSLCDEGLIQMIDEKDFDYLSLNEALDETIRKYDSYLEKLKHYQIGDVNDKFYQEIVKVMNRGEKDESD